MRDEQSGNKKPNVRSKHLTADEALRVICWRGSGNEVAGH